MPGHDVTGDVIRKSRIDRDFVERPPLLHAAPVFADARKLGRRFTSPSSPLFTMTSFELTYFASLFFPRPPLCTFVVLNLFLHFFFLLCSGSPLYFLFFMHISPSAPVGQKKKEENADRQHINSKCRGHSSPFSSILFLFLANDKVFAFSIQKLGPR